MFQPNLCLSDFSKKKKKNQTQEAHKIIKIIRFNISRLSTYFSSIFPLTKSVTMRNCEVESSGGYR